MNPQNVSITGRVELAALRFNPGAKYRVLALHGWLDNAMSFAPLAAALPDCEITALDFAGHGESQHLPEGSWYHFVDYLDDVVAAMAALATPVDLLLGHSLGGAVATAYAAARGEDVRRLALIEALGPIAGAPEAAAQALRTGLDQRRALGGKRLRLFDDPQSAIEARLQANRMSPQSAELLISRGLRPAGDGWIWSSDPRLTVASPHRFHEAGIQAWISAIEAPTLLIAADHPPPYFIPATREARLACARTAQLQVVPGHHHLHMDNAEQVAAIVRRFLADIAQT